jgi:hypothetical protein
LTPCFDSSAHCICHSQTETNPSVVEDAVKYIIFLVDADGLFDTALGMYDFNLVLMIAQHAQKVRTLFCPLFNASHLHINTDFTDLDCDEFLWAVYRIQENTSHSFANCGLWTSIIKDSKLMTIYEDITRLCRT